MQFLIVDKLSNVAEHHRRSVILWFFYHFVMVCLCTINIVFLIVNWCELHVNIDSATNILLTIIGFLFAFAGINLYSIFNTNIESEKQKLIELQEIYKAQTLTNIELMKFSASINKLQLYSQLIFSSKKMNSQILEWATIVADTINSIQLYLEEIKHKETHDFYEKNNNDVLALSRGFRYQGIEFLNYIKTPQGEFFRGVSEGIKLTVIDEMENLLEKFDIIFPMENQIDDNEQSTNNSPKWYSKIFMRFISKLKLDKLLLKFISKF